MQIVHSSVVDTSFDYQVALQDQFDDSHISLSVIVSSVSKITCVVGAADADAIDLTYEESTYTRYYVHSKRNTTLTYRVQYLPFDTQRLFCNITGLQYDPPRTEYYASEPFHVKCISRFMLPL